MPPCLYLRDWYESGKSSHSDQAYRLPYLPTLVSPFHAEPLHPVTVKMIASLRLFPQTPSREAGGLLVLPSKLHQESWEIGSSRTPTIRKSGASSRSTSKLKVMPYLDF
jgi:hypothetical protein